MITKSTCQCEGCDSDVRCKGLCNKHYHVLKASRKMKSCACGCGELTAYTYRWGHHTRLFSSEEQSRRGRQNDGSALRGTGEGVSYVKVGGRHEHRVVAEKVLGRPLEKGEVVHHVDENIRNNRPENLRVMTQSEHVKLHHPEMLAARKAIHGY